MRNQNSHFALNPTNLQIGRSKFDMPYTYKTSMNVGDIIPFYCMEVLPGDTHQIKTNKVVRMQPLVSSPMDNLYLDTYYFFVPNRLVWEHWKEFNGENTASAWIPSTEYEIPQLEAPTSTGWTKGTLADYFGIPTGVDDISVNALPFRAYALIMNEWFRDENLSQPLNIPVDDTTITGVNTGNQVTDIVKGGLPFKAAKFHDYFTSALPAPQKGPDVTIGITDLNPRVVTGDSFTPPSTDPMTFSVYNPGTNSINISQNYGYAPVAYHGGATEQLQSKKFKHLDSKTNSSSSSTAMSDRYVIPDNLYAELGQVNIVSINQLRQAFQIQKLYERDARGGTRYTEILRSHFGVTSPDARLQRPEYLGGNRIPININQVLQTSETGSTPQGNIAGYSLTNDSHGDFIQSFTEHGYIIGLMVARYDHTYQQGLERHWSRKGRFDYYWPVLANIGEQAILNKEIYCDGSSYDDEVFGYQEAWAEYRYKPSIVTGEMRSNVSTSLDSWHFADDYSSLPVLSDTWIREDKSNIDRVLAVQSSVSNQLFADIYVENEATRPMPLYSIPGLIDHN